MSRKPFNTLNDALAFQLSSMYDAEQRIRQEMAHFCDYSNFIHLQNEIEKYIEQSSNKIIKLERIFNYLMEEPGGNSNNIVASILTEIESNVKNASSPRLRDLMLTSSFLAMNQYKLGIYSCALVISLELEVETVSDLLKEIVNWEKETSKSLSKLAMEEVVYQSGYSLY
jgi:ferritin-like metal-binding protein YciE